MELFELQMLNSFETAISGVHEVLYWIDSPFISHNGIKS